MGKNNNTKCDAETQVLLDKWELDRQLRTIRSATSITTNNKNNKIRKVVLSILPTLSGGGMHTVEEKEGDITPPLIPPSPGEQIASQQGQLLSGMRHIIQQITDLSWKLRKDAIQVAEGKTPEALSSDLRYRKIINENRVDGINLIDETYPIYLPSENSLDDETYAEFDMLYEDLKRHKALVKGLKKEYARRKKKYKKEFDTCVKRAQARELDECENPTKYREPVVLSEAAKLISAMLPSHEPEPAHARPVKSKDVKKVRVQSRVKSVSKRKTKS